MIHSNPLISIIVPVYNAEKFIAKGLDSLAKQTYPHIEVLCVNDGSKDNSGKIIDQFAQQYPQIKAFHQKNSGPAKARNKALDNASGDYIMFCDADDYYEPDMCEAMLRTIQEQQVDLVLCDCFVDKTIETNRDDVNNTDENYLHIKLIGKHDLDDEKKYTVNNMLWNKIFRKELVDQYHIAFPIGYEHDDSAFVWQYLSVSKSYYGLNRQLYHYIIHPNSLMTNFFSNINGPKKLDFVYALAYFLQFLHKNNLLKKYGSYFELIFIRYFSWYFNLVSPLTKISLLKTVRDEILPTLPQDIVQRNPFLGIVEQQLYDRLVDLSWSDRKHIPEGNQQTVPSVDSDMLQQVFDKFLTLIHHQSERNEEQFIQLIQSFKKLNDLVNDNTQQASQNTEITYNNLGEAQLLKLLFNDASSTDERLIALLKNLDANSSETVIKIVQRLMMVKQSANQAVQTGLSFYSIEEQQQLYTLFKTFTPNIYHMNDDYHLYHDFVLPTDSFAPHLFYNNHSLDMLNHPERIKQKTIIDIHGGIGESALLLQQLQPKKIISFEKDAKNSELMMQTMALNNLKNTDISDVDINSTAATPITLDSYLQAQSIKDIGFIKINSETDTRYLLESAAETIKKYRPVLMINISQDWTTFVELKPFIESWDLGYQFKVHKPVTTCIMLDTVLIAEQP